nr:hypothetical protein [Escherichia coli]
MSEDVALPGNCPKLLKKIKFCMTLVFAAETDYLFTLEEYSAELGGLVFLTGPLKMYISYTSSQWKSRWKNVRHLVITKITLFH